MRLRSYFIALGSNLGDREANLRDGWEMLSPICRRMRISRLYETLPMYVERQPQYLNAVGEAFTSAAPLEMLDVLHSIERRLGRDRAREQRNGPRTLDLDILLCGDAVIDTPGLTIPHPRLAERRFVLVPLLELSRSLRDPRTGERLGRALALLEAAQGAGGPGGVYLYRRR